jgi:hypothetical protein
MHTNLTCRCGVKIPVTGEQANGTVQCRSCLNRIHVPPEKVLVDLGALDRDVRLRTVGFIIMGVLVVAAIAAGVFTQSKRDTLAAEARSVVNSELSEKHGIPARIIELQRKNPHSADIGPLGDIATKLKDLPTEPREVRASFKEVRDTLKEIDSEYRNPSTKNWLADADFADFTQSLLYGFVIGTGVVFLFLIIISARVSTHRHRIIAYEKQAHTKVISR